MWPSSHKVKLVSREEALPGRSERMPVPEAHFVNGAPLEPPFPEGTELALFGLGCFWGAERKFWQTPGVYLDRRRLRGRLHAQPDLRGGLLRPHRPHRGGARGVRPEDGRATTSCCASSGRATTRRRGCARATTSGTQYRSAIYTYGEDQQREAPRPRATPTRRRSPPRGHGAITTEIRDGARVLLRRGVPPAVPGEEPGRATAASAAPGSPAFANLLDAAARSGYGCGVRRRASVKILVVDVGGNNVKLLVSGQKAPRKVPSGPTLTAARMATSVRKAVADWRYDAVTIGFPGPVSGGRPAQEPVNLGRGWVRFDYAAGLRQARPARQRRGHAGPRQLPGRADALPRPRHRPRGGARRRGPRSAPRDRAPPVPGRQDVRGLPRQARPGPRWAKALAAGSSSRSSPGCARPSRWTRSSSAAAT